MKAQLKRIATMLLVVAMSLTQVPQMPLGNTADTSAQAAAGGGTLSYVARYSSNAVLGKLDNHHSTAMMSHIKMNGQEVFCTAIGRGALSGNYKGITVNYGSYLKLMKGAAYYRKVSKGSYEATQILIWRIKQMQENKTAATAANVMNGDVKDCFNHFASGEFDKAKAVMQRAEKNEFSKAKLEDYSSGNSTQSVVWLDAREEFCSVKLTKKGENTGTKADCSGAVFTVYKGNRAVTSFATDADGKGKSEQVLDTYTTYKVKETKAPKGCVKSDKEYTVKTGGADSVTPVGNNGVITNKEKELQFDILKIGVYVSTQKTKGKKGKVTITKVQKNKKLEGVKFAVQEWSASKHAWNTLETKKTNSKGKVKSSKLKYTRDNQGKFRMKEISSVEGFKVTSNSKVEGVTYSYTGGYKGQWSAETNYVIGDVVTCDDILYQCVEEKSTGVKPSDSCGYKGDDKGSKWEVLNDFTGKNGEADIRGVFSTDKDKMQKGGFAARFRSEIFRFTSGLYKLKGVRALQGDDAKENSKSFMM